MAITSASLQNELRVEISKYLNPTTSTDVDTFRTLDKTDQYFKTDAIFAAYFTAKAGSLW